MDAITGRAIEGDAHLAQSIADILTTPIGSRVMRRDYGSALFELLDQPMNALGRVRLFAAIADALRRWEPRITLTRVAIEEATAAGRFTVALTATRTDGASATDFVRLVIPLRFAAPTA